MLSLFLLPLLDSNVFVLALFVGPRCQKKLLDSYDTATRIDNCGHCKVTKLVIDLPLTLSLISIFNLWFSPQLNSHAHV